MASIKKAHNFAIKRAKNGEFFWRCVNYNGKEIERSSETYKRRLTAIKSLYSMIRSIRHGDYTINEGADE